MSNFPFLFGTPWPWWLIVFCGAGAGWLTVRGYRRRAGEVKPQRLKVLRYLRLAGWTLLIITLLQPMRREYTKENKSSRLTVLVDDSESMSFTDMRNGPTRMQRVKTMLGGEKLTTAKVEEAVLGDGSLLNTLSRSFQVQLEALGPGARSVAHGAPVELARGLARDIKAEGESTDIAKGLAESFSRLKGPDAGGLVLVSDGADNARGDIERVLSGYKRAGTPVYVVGVGQPDLQDLAVAQVRCRRTVSKDTLVRVEVDVKRTAMSDDKHVVTITRNKKTIGNPVTLEMKGDTATAVFEFLPEGQGFLEYEATVEPFAGELVTVNNTLGFGFVSYSRKLRVLYMEGSMYVHATYNSQSQGMYYSHPMQKYWEHQFLELALQEDLDIEVDVLAKDEFPTPRGANQIKVPTVKEAYPKTKKELYQYDVIINSDIPFSRFTPEQVQWTVDFVGKHGGGFVMIGGYDAFGEGGYAKTSFDRMLPVEMSAGDAHLNDIDFTWQITDEGFAHPIMQVEKEEEANRKAWSRLPSFHGFSRTTRPKPAATTLAVVANEEDYGTAYGPAILLAVQPFGNGRSMAFTTDSTGGWGAEWQDTWGPEHETSLEKRNLYYKTFWKNAVRWLAHYRMQAPNQLVQIESDRLVYGRGEQPNIRVKVMNEDYELSHDAKVTLNVVAADGKTQNVTVFPKYDEPGIYERKLELNNVGRYDVEAVAVLKKEELGRDKTLLQVRPASAEMRQLSQNVELLKKIAEGTGGVYLPLEKASELPQYLREATHVIEKHRDNDLWDRPWIFMLIIALLCGEWFLRKRSGLP